MDAIVVVPVPAISQFAHHIHPPRACAKLPYPTIGWMNQLSAFFPASSFFSIHWQYTWPPHRCAHSVTGRSIRGLPVFNYNLPQRSVAKHSTV